MRSGATSWAAPLLALALQVTPGLAQEAVPPSSTLSRHALVVEAALEPELVVSLRYLRRLAGAGIRPRLEAGIGVKLPPYLADRGSGRLDLLARGQWTRENGLGVSATSAAYLARNHNRSGTMHGLGVEIRMAPGYHGRHWNVTADLGWQGTLLTHIRHSDLVRDTYEERYPESGAAQGPRDGWYGVTAERFRIGLGGARSVTETVSLRVALGTLFSVQRQGLFLSFAHGQVPVYVEVSGSASW